MRKAPLLDPRSKADILEELKTKSLSYTPEWRYSGRVEDAGGALCALFGDMFSETIDRFNRVPHKNYVAFLNLLNVRRNPVVAARGVVCFDADTADGSPAPVPRGTQLYASGVTDDDGSPMFETLQSVYALPGSITARFTADPQKDCIERKDGDGPLAILFADEENNLQSHRFALGHGDVFALRRPCAIELQLEHAVRFHTPACIAALSDPGRAVWTYSDGEREYPFDKVYAKDDSIILEKHSARAIAVRDGADEPAYPIACRVLKPADAPDIRVRSIKVKSSLLNDAPCFPDALFFNENAVEEEPGGYCFGRAPTLYDCFYVASRDIFSKRGARVNMSLNMTTVVHEQMTPDQQYDFNRNKYIIDKDAVKRTVPDIFVSTVVWEYWNGLGWNRLKVEGDQNPFSCRQDGEKHVRFHCPADIVPTVVNAENNYFIRARVAFVENAFDPTGRMLLPFVKGARLHYVYDEPQRAERIMALNNCEESALAEAAAYDSLDFTLYRPLPFENTAHYIAFENPPVGYPISMHLELECTDGAERVIEYQVLTEKGFEEVRALDGTDNLQRSGVVSLFITAQPQKRSLFGVEAYWLRLLDAASRYAPGDHSRLKVKRLTLNAVEAVQQQTAEDEYFPTVLFEANKTVELANRPVLSAEVWVNEWDAVSPEKLAALSMEDPARVMAERDGQGHVTACFVRWERVASFLDSGRDSRHYMLEPMTGAVTFGDGINGMPPAPGERSIRVRYTYGGGARGNLPAGALDSIMGSLPNITGVRNFLPTCGGNDMQSVETVERLGPMRLRHRARALTAEDYENIVLEMFGQVRDVRCFAGITPSGGRVPGHITVVVMGQDYDSPSHALLLCREVMDELKERADLQVVSEGLLHVIPAEAMTLSVSVKLHLDDFNEAALVEKKAKDALAAMITGRRINGHYIGNLPGRADVYAAMKAVPHVRAAQDAMIEGRFYRDGQERLVSLDEGGMAYPFSVALSGSHRIRF